MDAHAPNELDLFEETSHAKINSFFDSAPPLKDEAEIKTRLEEFVERNISSSENEGAVRVACVTSGGTTVPLEQECVRYIDNFASGHRGAASTEYFLKAGYAVVFVYRRGSCQSYCQFLPEDPLLQCFQLTGESDITVQPTHARAVKRAIAGNHDAVTAGTLLKLPFTTVFEYLQILQLVALSMKRVESRALFFLAAAVSDFYVPWECMAVHKIESRCAGPLDIQLAQVPKMLSALRNHWAPSSFCVSFKLETDSEILLKKAAMALKNYNMHMVVANELATYKQFVIVVTNNGNVTLHRQATDVEEPLIKLIVDAHSAYVALLTQ